MDAETARVPQAEPPLVPHLELHLPLQALPTSWPGQADPKLKPCSLSRKIVTYKLPGQSAPACACVQKATAPLASGAAYQSPEQRRPKPHRQPLPQVTSRAEDETVAQHNVAPAMEGNADVDDASNGDKIAAD